jgi:hypothetical protein
LTRERQVERVNRVDKEKAPDFSQGPLFLLVISEAINEYAEAEVVLVEEA